MKTVTFFETLLKYAREEALAKESGDSARYQLAKEKHEMYRQLCLDSDEMIITSTQTRRSNHA